MKEYQIRIFGLNDLEEKLNRFFEQHRKSDLLTITTFGSIAELEPVKGKTIAPVIVSVYYVEPHIAPVTD